MANAILRASSSGPFGTRQMEDVLAEYPLGRKALAARKPRETPINPKPIEPSVLDWSADWLHREVPAISDHECKRLMMACVTRREEGKSLSVTETRWLQAWDSIISERRSAETSEVSR